jgi:hypothetical protein
LLVKTSKRCGHPHNVSNPDPDFYLIEISYVM